MIKAVHEEPTIFNWGLAVVFLGFQFIGERTLLERALGAQLTLAGLDHLAGQGIRVGMLYVGVLEAKYREIRNEALSVRTLSGRL